MSRISYSHLDDGGLLHTLDDLIGGERTSMASLVACLAEVDLRRLYAPAGFSSMYRYCIDGKGMSEDAAHRRIQAARLARRFPGIIPALADGRLHLSGLLLLREYLTHANARELLTAACGKSKRAIAQMLAERFPRPDVPTRIVAIAPSPAPARVADPIAESPAPARVEEPIAESPALARVEEPVRASVVPLSAERYALQVSISRETRDLLERFQELLGHSVPAGDVEGALKMALEIGIRDLERSKHAVTDRPRAARASRNPRHIPATVKRAVRARDGDRCTFVNDRGQRCTERKGLEYDHAEPVARGGTATVSTVRLLCRTHNQLEAERVFGAAFMRGKRSPRPRTATAASATARPLGVSTGLG